MDFKVGEEAILLGTIAQVMPDPIFIIDEYGVYVEVLGGSVRDLYDSGDFLRKKTLHDVFPQETADRFRDTVKKALVTEQLQVIEYQLTSEDMNFNPMDGPAEPQWYEGRILPFSLHPDKKSAVLWIAINITEKKKVLQERDEARKKLAQAQNEIEILRRILPVCSICKEIRNDRGYWQEVNEYLEDQSSAIMGHGVCPRCREKPYTICSDDIGSGTDGVD